MSLDVNDAYRRAMAGETFEAIGTRYGVTRQAVDIALRKRWPWKPWHAVKVERAAIERDVREVARKLERERSCKLCGARFSTSDAPGRPRKFCRPEHEQMFRVIRYQVDDARYVRSRRATAAWQLRNPDTCSEAQLRYARRVLAGEVAHSRGRSVTPGSEAHRVLTLAYERGWPVFDEASDAVRAQIKEENA